MISSVETTTAIELGLDCSSSEARSIERREAEQPWPERLYVRMFERMPKRLDAIAQREGVGENSEQLITRKSTSRGWTPVRSKSAVRQLQMMVSASSRVAAMLWSEATEGCLHRERPGGHAVPSPVPELASTLPMNSRSAGSYEPTSVPMFFMVCMISSLVRRHSAGGSKTEKSTR